LLAEDKIGTMLPCNVTIQQVAAEAFEVAAVDPAARCKRSKTRRRQRSRQA
jgi:uncharacterized protein (DUF302 family)